MCKINLILWLWEANGGWGAWEYCFIFFFLFLLFFFGGGGGGNLFVLKLDMQMATQAREKVGWDLHNYYEFASLADNLILASIVNRIQLLYEKTDLSNQNSILNFVLIIIIA